MPARPSSAGDDPLEFCCPISGQIMEDPVVLVQTGHTFDRKNIQKWFAEGKDICPMTSIKLQSIQLTPNYALRGSIHTYLEKKQRAGHSTPSSYPAIQGNMYPQLDRVGMPNDKQAQVLACLASLRSASAEIRGFRDQKEYELWTLSKLMPDSSCLEEFLANDGPASILRFLAHDNSPGVQGAAAQIVAGVAASSRGQDMYQQLYTTGGLGKLVALLTVEGQAKAGQISCRESASNALTKLAVLSTITQAEVLFNLCAASSLPINGQKRPPSFVVPLKALFSSDAESENRAAARLAAQVIKGMNLKEYRDYSSCEGTEAIPCLVSLLPGTDSLSAGAVLSALMYTTNQASVFQNLVQVLADPALGRSAGVLLWEAIAANSGLVGVLNQIVILPGVLEASLRERTLIGAGITQLVACEFPRLSNTAILPANTDDMRLRLISQPQVIPALVEMLHSQEQVVAQAAIHALANLSAFRSGSHGGGESRLHRRSHSAQARQNHPCSVIAYSEALPQMMGLLNCPQASIVGPCLALLHNLCAENAIRDRVRESASLYGYEQVRNRLEALRGWSALPDQCRAAARVTLQRLEERKNDRQPQQYNYITMLMRPPR